MKGWHRPNCVGKPTLLTSDPIEVGSGTIVLGWLAPQGVLTMSAQKLCWCRCCGCGCGWRLRFETFTSMTTEMRGLRLWSVDVDGGSNLRNFHVCLDVNVKDLRNLTTSQGYRWWSWRSLWLLAIYLIGFRPTSFRIVMSSLVGLTECMPFWFIVLPYLYARHIFETISFFYVKTN